LKFGIFVHPKRPKVPAEKIAMRIRSAGLICSQIEPDIAIVVGGDGTFGYYGRILAVPMLFVGVKEPDDILGSRARLAETMYDCLDRALRDVDAGKYRVIEKKKLSVSFGGQGTDVLTDVYLERGQFAGCVRYTVHISNRRSSFSEYAIGNGVIVSTSYGSGGYFSYPNILKSKKEWNQKPSSIERFSDNRLGVCHILPTYLIRLRNGKRDLANKLQFTVPIEAQIQVKLVRNADVRLYGTTDDSRGKKILLNDTISISSSNQTAKIVKLKA
jgi:NAD+ kinase